MTLGHDRAAIILREFQASIDELVGCTAILADGKSGTIENVYIDDLHGLRISIAGHEGKWPISTVKFVGAS